MARRKRGIATNFLATLFVALFAIALTVFWEGIVPVAIFIILITPLMAILAGLPRKYYLPLFLMVIAASGGILYADANPLTERLQSSTPAAIAGLAFLGTTGLLFVTVTIIARSKNYTSLRNQLLVSFLIIVTVPTLLATVLSAVGAYVNNEAQALNTLQAVSNLEENQINVVVNTFKNNATRISRDPAFARSIGNVLSSTENRSEERRVGKECRSRWSPYH